MSVLVVNSAAALNKALLTAQSGETIELASGTYAGIVAKNLHLSGVTITSENPANAAVLTGLNVTGSSGLAFTNLTLSAAANTSYYAFLVNQSSNLQFSNLQVTGLLAKNPTQTGIIIENSSNVTVQNSQFEQFQAAIIEENNANITISGNKFQQLDGDGVDNVGTSNVTISDNTFTDFIQPTNGTHPDAIQFWTAGTTASVSNINVTGNTIDEGTGSQMQGIFITDQVGDLPFQNLSITNNTITGGDANAVYVSDANNVVISGNSVEAGSVNTNWIGVTKATNVSLSDNSAPFFNIGLVSAISVATNAMNGTLQTDSVSSAANINMIYSDPTSHNLTLTGLAKLTAWANSLGDHITGNNAGDTFYGGSGADTLVGGAGNDIFNAGTGNDTMTGGAGTNTFVFGLTSASDVITDFHAGTHDVINLAAYINAGVRPVLQNSGANVIIELEAGHSITLLGVQASQLVHTATGYTI